MNLIVIFETASTKAFQLFWSDTGNNMTVTWLTHLNMFMNTLFANNFTLNNMVPLSHWKITIDDSWFEYFSPYLTEVAGLGTGNPINR